MADTMLERVAEALWRASRGRGPRWGNVSDVVRAGIWYPAARAAIEAMREPTEEMRHAELRDLDTCAGFLDDYSATQVWQAMISAALGEAE